MSLDIARMLISSDWRNTDTNETPTNFTNNVANIHDGARATGCTLVMGCIPNLFYNVESRTRLFYTYGGTPFSLQIPAGLYSSGANFATALETALNAAHGPATFTVNYFQNITTTNIPQLQIISAGSTFSIRPTNDADALMQEDHNHTPIVSRTLNRMIGARVSEEFPEAASWVSTHPVNLSGPNFVNVCSERMASSKSTELGDGRSLHCLATIPINAQYGAKLYFTPESRGYFGIDYNNDRAFGTIDIQLLDEHGALLELPPNANVCLSIAVSLIHQEF